VDAAEPPNIVFEQPAPCSDAARAEALLRRTLTPARAPRGSWTVTMRVSAATAEGEITDDTGAPVAHRVLVKGTAECAGLARAVGVWASLVLDAELHRLPDDPIVSKLTIARDADKKSLDATALLTSKTTDLPPLWPAPAINEKPSPEQFAILRHAPDQRSVEVGVSSFIMGGTGAGALAGPALYGVIEVGDGIFLRPTLAFGRTLTELKPAGDVYGTWGITRFDTCLRIPGFYRDRRGMQLDTCAGADVGFLHFDQSSTNVVSADAAPRAAARTIPFLAFGPSLGLRGELGSDLAVELRGVIGLNVIRESFQDPAFGSRVDPPLIGGRVELGLSWRVR
jgi:hypothetical protein